MGTPVPIPMGTGVPMGMGTGVPIPMGTGVHREVSAGMLSPSSIRSVVSFEQLLQGTEQVAEVIKVGVLATVRSAPIDDPQPSCGDQLVLVVVEVATTDSRLCCHLDEGRVWKVSVPLVSKDAGDESHVLEG